MTEIVDQGAVEGQATAEPAPELTAEPAPSTPESEPEPTLTRAQVQQLIAARDSQWQQWASHYVNQAQGQAAPVEVPTTPAATVSDIESEIAALYTDDETGKRTRDAIEKHLRLRMKALGVDPETRLTREEVAQIAESQASRVRDQIRSGLTVTQEVSDLVNRGVIADEDAALVQRAYTSTLNLPTMREAAENPDNAGYILSRVVLNLIKEGRIKPFSKPRPTSPLQPGGNGAPAAVKAPSIDPSKSPFKSVRALTKDQLKAARSTSEENYRRANRG